MNDAIGSVFIEDPSGNTWMMDGKGNISVHAPNDISMSAGGSISLTAGQNITASATVDIIETAGVDKMTSVGMMHNVFVGGNSMTNVLGSMLEIVKGNRNSETAERNEVAKSAKFSASEKDIVVNATKKVTNNSTDKTNLF